MKILITLLLAFSFATSAAQWNSNSNGIDYSSGNVGIGTLTPGYKLDVAGAVNLFKGRFQGPDGYILIGPANSGWAHIYTDRPNFIFNQNVWSIPGGFSSYSSADLTLQTNGTTRLTISNASGNVGIGTFSVNNEFKLSVNGKIRAEEVQVVVDVPADYVFEADYKLLPLQEVEQFIKENKHLPGVPNAQAITTNGWNVGEMNNKLLEKVEELTLYMIEMRKENEALKKEVKELKQLVKPSRQ